ANGEINSLDVDKVEVILPDKSAVAATVLIDSSELDLILLKRDFIDGENAWEELELGSQIEILTDLQKIPLLWRMADSQNPFITKVPNTEIVAVKDNIATIIWQT
ncbi:MAG: hypothetical protein V2I33_25610, partial [Kangiellaceae bacterium]|nr:hypothetical protein [Kangiellaceae bacterium]